MTQSIAIDLAPLILELTEVRAKKDALAKRESAIRGMVLESVGKVATPITDTNGVIIAEIVESVRRSVGDWDTFEATYPDAYKALVKFTDVLTLNLAK